MTDAPTDGLRWLEQVGSRRGFTGEDLHLVPGLVTPSWRELLFASIAGQLHPASQLPAGWSIAVTTALDTAPSAATAGITIDATTAAIQLGPLAPPPRVLSFVVTAQLLTPEQTAAGEPLHRRVHCHGAVDAIWVAPATFELRSGLSQRRLTVHARFDDGVIGDLTGWNVLWEQSLLWQVRSVAGGQPATPALTWDSTSLDPDDDAPSVYADEAGFLRQVPLLDHDSLVTATLSLPGGPTLTGQATVSIVPAWPPSTEVSFVAVTRPEPTDVTGAVNVLFLPDGFTGDQQQAFADLVDEIVRLCTTEAYLTPFDRAGEAVNWFRAWVPSAQAGVSWLRPVDRYPDPPLVRSAVTPTPPPGPSVVVGDPGQRPAGSGSILLDDHDTAFGVGYGFRPMAVPPGADRTMGFDPRHASADDLDTFLGTLTGIEDADRRWRSGGIDDRFVVILCAINVGQATNSTRPAGGRVVCAGLGGPQATIAPAGDGWQMDAPVMPPNVFALARVIAHELGHSLWLGDEYAIVPGQHPEPTQVRRYANLQARVDVAGAAGRLDPARIAWTWPRVRAAASLTVAATVTPDSITVTVPAQHAEPFVVGEEVRLRTRPLLSGFTSPPLVVRSITPDAPGLSRVVLAASDGGLPSVPFATGSVLLAPARTTDGVELGLVAAPMLAHLAAHANPLDALPTDPDGRPCTSTTEIREPTPATNPPPGLPVDYLSQHLVGLWEGGDEYTCGVFHPAGACMMSGSSRDAERTAAHPRFCAVCRYILIDELAPHLHPQVDADYDGWPAGVP